MRCCCFVKLRRAEQIPVVRNGQGGHAQFHGSLHQARNLAGAVQETVVRVQVQMDKVLGRHGRMIAEILRSTKKLGAERA
jgi:hypothetical protein